MKNYFLNNIYATIIKISNIINFRKQRVLIYTDSRGFNVLSKSGKNPFNSYIKYFIKDYRVDYFICPEKHTTIPDFLLKYNDLKHRNYDFVIMHCGVVDFSPRPISNLEWVLSSKSENKYFQISVQEYGNYYKKPSNILYNNEKTINIYSTNFLKNIIIPDLLKIKNLLWINSNRFVKGWEGNYTKGRPSNINQLVSDFDRIMEKNLEYTINLRSWDDDSIMKFTMDNIHFNKNGFYEVFSLIKSKIVELKSKSY
jgi:hypothetical protein